MTSETTTSSEATASAADALVPAIEVTGGNPTAEEIAAVVTVVLAAASGSAEEPKAARSLWGAPVMRRPHQAGPGAWQHSARN